MEAATASPRRNGLDWLRVGALGLLIVTHVTYVHRTTGWRIHSEHAGLWADLIVEAMAPWRMTLVFFIGGAAARFMMEKHSLGAFALNRFLRLGVPFLMAVILLVPLMWYVTDPESRNYSYVQYVLHTPLHAHRVFGLHLPDLAHVWFLSYLLAYTLLAGLAWRFASKLWRATEAFIARRSMAAILMALAVLFVLSDAVLRPVFGRSDMLVDDPAGHLRCLPPFLLGVMVARADAFWRKLDEARAWLLPAAVGLAIAALAVAAEDTLGRHQMPAWQTGLADGFFGAAAVLAILGAGHALLNRRSRMLDYLGDAIMPVYLMHQLVIVLVGTVLLGARLPVLLEYPALLGATALIPLAIYHVAIRRTGVLRVMFGLKAAVASTGVATGVVAGVAAAKITTP